MPELAHYIGTYAQRYLLTQNMQQAVKIAQDFLLSGILHASSKTMFPHCVCIISFSLRHQRSEQMPLATAHSALGLSASTFAKLLAAIRDALKPSFSCQLSRSVTYETLVHTELVRPAGLPVSFYDSTILLMHEIEEIVLNDNEFHDILHFRYHLVVITVFCWVCARVKASF